MYICCKYEALKLSTVSHAIAQFWGEPPYFYSDTDTCLGSHKNLVTSFPKIFEILRVNLVLRADVILSTGTSLYWTLVNSRLFVNWCAFVYKWTFIGNKVSSMTELFLSSPSACHTSGTSKNRDSCYQNGPHWPLLLSVSRCLNFWRIVWRYFFWWIFLRFFWRIFYQIFWRIFWQIFGWSSQRLFWRIVLTNFLTTFLTTFFYNFNFSDEFFYEFSDEFFDEFFDKSFWRIFWFLGIFFDL